MSAGPTPKPAPDPAPGPAAEDAKHASGGFAFTPVFEGEHLRAALHPGQRPLLVVTFDYRRRERQGFNAPNYSSSFARQGYGQLSITCRVNDWFINPDTEALERAVEQVVAPYAQVRALGFSMGGYGAFRFARALRLDNVVAVSPQATIAPGAVRGDRRYAEEAAAFDADLGDLQRRGRPDLGGIILVDPFARLDLAHARLIQNSFPRLSLVRLGHGGHPASRLLREARTAWLIQREVTAPAPDGAAIRRAHRQARAQSALYWETMADRLERRHPEQASLARDRAAACRAARLEREEAARQHQITATARNAQARNQQVAAAPPPPQLPAKPASPLAPEAPSGVPPDPPVKTPTETPVETAVSAPSTPGETG